MKFSEEILKELNLEQSQEKEPVNVMRVDEMLEFMKNCSVRIEAKSKIYTETNK